MTLQPLDLSQYCSVRDFLDVIGFAIVCSPSGYCPYIKIPSPSQQHTPSACCITSLWHQHPLHSSPCISCSRCRSDISVSGGEPSQRAAFSTLTFVHPTPLLEQGREPASPTREALQGGRGRDERAAAGGHRRENRGCQYTPRLTPAWDGWVQYAGCQR